jgi:hypothetical protein
MVGHTGVGRKPLWFGLAPRKVGRRLPIPLRSVCDPYLGNHLEGSDLPFEPQLQTAWVSCGKQTQVTSCKRGSLLLTSCTWLRQLRQHRIHVRLDGCKLIFEELHVALIKRCPLRYGCARLH